MGLLWQGGSAGAEGKRVAPVYLQLKQALAQDISDGKVQPGDLLPSEAELMKAWSVSQITVRNAIKELVRDGFAYTLHGKGTFVAEQKITNYLPSLTSLSHDVSDRGMTPGSRLLLLETIQADKDIASHLHVSPGSPIIHFDRVTFGGRRALSLSDTRMCPSRPSPLIRMNFRTRVSKTTASISCCAASE